MPKLYFTDSVINDLPYSYHGPVDYQDRELPGFFLRVSAKAKTYYVRRMIRGTRKRISIGDAKTISATEARKLASKLLKRMIMNKAESMNEPPGPSSPFMQVQYRLPPITLDTAFHDLAELAQRDRTTVRGYLDCLNGPLANVRDELLPELSTVEALRLHREMTKRQNREHADRCLRALRDVLEFAMIGYRNAAGDALVRHNPFEDALAYLSRRA